MYRLHLQYTQKREGWRAGNDKMGPNDARHIIWAPGEFLSFFFFLSVLFDTDQNPTPRELLVICHYHHHSATSPSSRGLRCVVSWAQVSFFLSFFILSLTIYLYIQLYDNDAPPPPHTHTHTMPGSTQTGSGKGRGQGRSWEEGIRGSRCDAMCLEPMYVFFTVLTKTKTLWAGMDGDLYGNQDC